MSMADSWKSIDLNKFIVNDDMIDYALHKIEKVGKHLNKVKEKMDVNNGREKMVMKTEVIIIESDTSYDHKPFQVIYAESSDHNSFQATSDESSNHNSFQATFDDRSNHNPFQATSDESSDHNHFQATSDDTLKSSSKDTCSSDINWEQKNF
ncbi:hypothetical protein Tco_0904753 [Tanacetum coccineum]